MATTSAALGVYIVKISDVYCSRNDSFGAVLEKAAKFYSSFLQYRSFRACRDDLDPSDTTWAILSFRNKDDAVKCAQWLSSENVLSGNVATFNRPSSSFQAKVLQRVQAPAADLQKAAAEAKQRLQEISKWERGTQSLPTHPQSPTIQLGGLVEPTANKVATTTQGDPALVQSKNQAEVARHVPQTEQQKPRTSASKKPNVTIGLQQEVAASTAPPMDEKKITKSKEMIAQGLSEAMDASAIQSSTVMRSELANTIVDAILALKVDAHEFVEKIRHLHFNLRRNGELRASVLEGTIVPSALVVMTSEEMQTKEQTEKRKLIEQKSLNGAVLPHGDLVFGRNIDAALQLKREAQGLEEPRYSDADQFANSNGGNNNPSRSHQKHSLIANDLADIAVDEAQPTVPRKRKRDDGTASSSSDSDSDKQRAIASQIFDGKNAKKSVKFDGCQTGPSTKFVEKHLAQPIPKNRVLKHQSSVDERVSHEANVGRQQLDWGPPTEHVDPGGWQAPPILTNRGKIYQGTLKWANVTSDYQVDVEVVGFQPQTFIRLPSELDIVEGITFDEMKKSIEESGAQSWNLHRAWIVGPKMPELFGRPYLESLKPTTSESLTTQVENPNAWVGNEYSTDLLVSNLRKQNGISPLPKSIRKTLTHQQNRNNRRCNGRFKKKLENVINESLKQRKLVGRILVNLNGEVLRNYNEGWAKGCHAGWELFIMEPTVAACEAASALLQEGNAARKSHALLMIAVPHYWGELLPLGENGIRQGMPGSRRLYVSACGASTLHKLPRVLNCELKAHRSRLNLNEIWECVFGEQSVRLYPREPTTSLNSELLGDEKKRAALQFEDDEDDNDEENQKNVDAFNALEKRLRESPDGRIALICQHDVPRNMDLAVAGPTANTDQKKYLLLGCWNRKIVPGVGHYAINFREPREWDI